MGQALRRWAVIPAGCADGGAPCKPPARQRVDMPGSLFEVSVEDCTNRVVTSPLIADLLVRHPDLRKRDGRRESTCRFRLAQQRLHERMDTCVRVRRWDHRLFATPTLGSMPWPLS